MSETDQYAFDSSVAEESVTALGGTIGALEASLADLDGFVNSLSANWEGDEQVTYQQVQTQWNNAANEVRQILQQVKTTLSDVSGSVGEMRAGVKKTLETS